MYHTRAQDMVKEFTQESFADYLVDSVDGTFMGNIEQHIQFWLDEDPTLASRIDIDAAKEAALLELDTCETCGWNHRLEDLDANGNCYQCSEELAEVEDEESEFD